MDNEHQLQLLKRFRIISYAEGISYLLLLFIAMPLKYTMDMPLAVKYTGWVHGILFIVYVYLVFPTRRGLNWTFRRTLFALIASVLPFGPFLFDRKLRQQGHKIEDQA
ncbi:hypothetical protein DN752_01980 [Echinicola strongylocentroti]|uniref:DUF3817 domain-containing protein n=1 Tax=Echinicola strongylocentroti TaxID=1795355 RepID=A0A2Z4ID91_9BACT|nr:DUF3817 domain-containing protein [Echinicola strongylocentroti]AWW29001.1 hypothetical protein DN752_01980 [Echinicola strongylocentroti]